MIPFDQWKWLGTTGHSLHGLRCLYRLHTVINGYHISSLGGRMDGAVLMKLESGSHFETVVYFGDDASTGEIRARFDVDQSMGFAESLREGFQQMNSLHWSVCEEVAKVLT